MLTLQGVADLARADDFRRVLDDVRHQTRGYQDRLNAQEKHEQRFYVDNFASERELTNRRSENELNIDSNPTERSERRNIRDYDLFNRRDDNHVEQFRVATNNGNVLRVNDAVKSDRGSEPRELINSYRRIEREDQVRQESLDSEVEEANQNQLEERRIERRQGENRKERVENDFRQQRQEEDNRMNRGEDQRQNREQAEKEREDLRREQRHDERDIDRRMEDQQELESAKIRRVVVSSRRQSLQENDESFSIMNNLYARTSALATTDKGIRGSLVDLSDILGSSVPILVGFIVSYKFFRY